jgi:DNA-binding response OmpR family regulator
MSSEIDVIVLGVMSPQVDGFGVMRELRAAKVTTPTIMLTARREATSCVAWIAGLMII